MRAVALAVAIGVAFVVVTAQSVSVARTTDIASALQLQPQQPLSPDAAAVRCFGVHCPVLPPMGSRGGLPLSLPQVLALSSPSHEQKLQELQPDLSAKPFLPPARTGTGLSAPNTQHLETDAQPQPQSQPSHQSQASASSAFADQLQRLQPQLQSAGQRVQQFGQSVGQRMQSFGKTIAGLGGDGGGGGGDDSAKADANAKAKANASAGGIDSAQQPLNVQTQQQLMQPLQPMQSLQPMQQSPLRDAKMEAALARGNLEPLTVVQPNARAGSGAVAVPNTLSAAGTGTRFVRDEQPALFGSAGVQESEGHGGGGIGFGPAIVAAVPTPVTNVLPAVAPVVPAIPLPPVAPPPVAPVATLAAVPIAVPICPHGHCH